MGFQIEKTWTLQELEKLYGSFSYEIEKRNISHKNLTKIICSKSSEVLPIYLTFDCDYDHFFQE